MSQRRSWGKVCCRGVYSCNWRGQEGNEKCACCGISFVLLVSLFSLCWLYVCLVTFNDHDDVNWEGFQMLKRWVNWFMVALIIYAAFTSYCVLLLIFGLFHVIIGEQLDLHWIHMILLFLSGLLIAAGFAGLNLQWKQEWPTIPLSLQATGPFLQFGAVVALTLLSPLVFRCFLGSKNGSKVLIALLFTMTSAAIFLSPLFIRSPCLLSELPEKPKLIGHRGAPTKAPENTIMSFSRSLECGVTAFETDVQLSKDRIPFLMHDNGSDFLLRTTNVQKTFPDTRFSHSANLTWEELQSLNAGEWFLETDPFHTVSQLSEDERKAAQSQSIPSLLQLLDLAKEHNISVIFDLYSPDQESDTDDTVKTILSSGIDPSLILWLPPDERDAVSLAAPGFTQVYNNIEEMFNKSGTHLNMKYNKLSTEEIRELRNQNKTVNLWVVNEPWLFSLMWCAGVSSVTTNSCHLFRDMKQPNWVMTLSSYRTAWILVDVVALLLMAMVFFIQCRKTESRRHYFSLARDRIDSIPTCCVELE